jgi:hypothetical protein
MTEPITPAQARELHGASIPDAVIKAVNELLVARFGVSLSALVLDLGDVVTAAIAIDPSLTAEALYKNHWLDIEPTFRRAGWKVRFEKPGFNESGSQCFIFEPAERAKS